MFSVVQYGHLLYSFLRKSYLCYILHYNLSHEMLENIFQQRYKLSELDAEPMLLIFWP